MFTGKGKVFINYRRDDSRFAAGLVYERLRRQFSASRLFIDVDSILGGADFPKLLETRLGQTRVMLSIIGDKWLDVRNPDGSRRLDDPGDFVRLEIVTALAHGVTVIPVLLDQAQLPEPANLPEELKPLFDRQVRRVRHDTFASDMALIINDIKVALRPPPEVVARRNRRIATGLVAAAATAGAVVLHEVWLSPLRDAVTSIQTVWADYQQSLRDRARIADQADWEVAVRHSSILGYERYLKEQPSGQYRAEAGRNIAGLVEAEERQRAAREQAAREEQERLRVSREKALLAQDEAAWANAQRGDQILDYRIYIANNPKGHFAEAAQTRIAQIEAAQKQAEFEAERRRERAAIEAERQADRQAWEQAQASGEVLAFRLYLQQRPKGEFATEAQKRVAALEEAQRRAEIEDQRRRERVAIEAERQADQQAWQQAQASGQVLAFSLYLQQRPKGEFAAQAQQRIVALEEAQKQAEIEDRRKRERAAIEAERQADQQAWEQAHAAGHVLAYRFYLQQKPNGQFASEAFKRIAALEEAAKVASEESRKQQEAARLAAAARDDEQRWQQAREIDTSGGYRAYLLHRPDPRFADLARQRLEALESQESEREAQRQAEIAELKRRIALQAQQLFADGARSGAANGPASPADGVAMASAADVSALTRELQRELKRVGCYSGEVDGIWGVNASGALKTFAIRVKQAALTDQPTIAALDAVMSQKLLVCPEECSRGERLENGRCVRGEREIQPPSPRARERTAPQAAPKTAALQRPQAAAPGGSGGLESSFKAQAGALRTACLNGSISACRTLCATSGGRLPVCERVNKLQYGSGLNQMGKRR